MDFTLKIFPTKPMELHGSQDALVKLIKNGIIKESADGNVEFCKPVKLKLNDQGANKLDSFIKEQWCPLFPTEKIYPTDFAPYYISGNTSQCKRYMEQFLNKHKKRFSYDCILIATSAFLYERMIKGWNATPKNYNFIRRDLESWCLDFLKDPKPMYRNAKHYYEHIRRTATRTRARHISADGYKLSTLVGSSDGGSNSDGLPAERQPDKPVGVCDTTGDNGSGCIQSAKPIRLTARAVRVNEAHKG